MNSAPPKPFSHPFKMFKRQRGKERERGREGERERGREGERENEGGGGCKEVSRVEEGNARLGS